MALAQYFTTLYVKAEYLELSKLKKVELYDEKVKAEKATTITDMYAALDLGQRTIQAVLKSEDGKIIKEIKTRKQADTILQFLKGTHTYHN